MRELRGEARVRGGAEQLSKEGGGPPTGTRGLVIFDVMKTEWRERRRRGRHHWEWGWAGVLRRNMSVPNKGVKIFSSEVLAFEA